MTWNLLRLVQSMRHRLNNKSDEIFSGFFLQFFTPRVFLFYAYFKRLARFLENDEKNFSMKFWRKNIKCCEVEGQCAKPKIRWLQKLYELNKFYFYQCLKNLDTLKANLNFEFVIKFNKLPKIKILLYFQNCEVVSTCSTFLKTFVKFWLPFPLNIVF